VAFLRREMQFGPGLNQGNTSLDYDFLRSTYFGCGPTAESPLSNRSTEWLANDWLAATLGVLSHDCGEFVSVLPAPLWWLICSYIYLPHGLQSLDHDFFPLTVAAAQNPAAPNQNY
jgi:hypothetical protein